MRTENKKQKQTKKNKKKKKKQKKKKQKNKQTKNILNQSKIWERYNICFVYFIAKCYSIL